MLFIFFFVTCENEGTIIAHEADIRIKDQRPTCYALEEDGSYLVQEDKMIGSNRWSLFYDEIEGFKYEEGYRYDLKVRIEKVANPIADASDKKYILLKVVAKERVKESPSIMLSSLSK